MTNKTQNCDLEIVSLVKSNFNFTGKTLIAIVVSHVVLLHIAVNVSLSLSSVLSCRPLPWSCRPLPCCPLPLSSRPLPLSLCHLSPPVSPLLLGGGVPWFVDFFVISGDWWDAELRGRVSHEPTKIHPQRFLIKSETIYSKKDKAKTSQMMGWIENRPNKFRNQNFVPQGLPAKCKTQHFRLNSLILLIISVKTGPLC